MVKEKISMAPALSDVVPLPIGKVAGAAQAAAVDLGGCESPLTSSSAAAASSSSPGVPGGTRLFS